MLIVLLIIVGCGKTKSKKEASFSSSFTHSKSSNYFSSTQKIVVNVYYEPGAEPFSGPSILNLYYWRILEDNLNAIFQYRTSKPVVIVPKLLSDMKSIPAQGKSVWTIDDVIDLYHKQVQDKSTTSEAHFHILFLKGYSSDSQNVIGYNITNTPVLAIFKDVITKSGSNIVQIYVEQSTVVHEMGHSLGFVNNGVPMKNNHQDPSHGSHSTNSDCVMYWLNEGTTGLSNYVQRFISTGTTVMWGPEVLADAQAYSK